MIWHAGQLQSQLTESAALRTAKLYSIALAEFRTFYTREIVEKVSKHGLKVTHDFVSRDDAIPLPATLSILARREYWSPYCWSKIVFI